MQNLMKGVAKLFTMLLLSHLLFFVPAIAEAVCGPDCCCGCHQGGVCNCNHEQGHEEYEQCCEEDEEQYYRCESTNCAYMYGKMDCSGVIRPTNINQGFELNEPCCIGGMWLPEDPPLFRPFMADPRQLTYSVGWRFNDNATEKNVIDVSFGDSVALYRWCNVWPWNGDLQIELEGGLWAIFDPSHDSAPLI
ncbi:MAG TPA: DUF1207 domain-containing protein, partial [Parachlamydiaceae bacterium]|nr:DUF1207 domain-containing protein [Parachlamydiaceae bacterium]